MELAYLITLEYAILFSCIATVVFNILYLRITNKHPWRFIKISNSIMVFAGVVIYSLLIWGDGVSLLTIRTWIFLLIASHLIGASYNYFYEKNVTKKE